MVISFERVVGKAIFPAENEICRKSVIGALRDTIDVFLSKLTYTGRILYKNILARESSVCFVKENQCPGHFEKHQSCLV